jgi:hypothetical protein
MRRRVTCDSVPFSPTRERVGGVAWPGHLLLKIEVRTVPSSLHSTPVYDDVSRENPALTVELR